MFEQYFKLVDQPFGATPDPRFLLRTDSHREALASLYAGFFTNRGFTVLIAEPGMGKTTLLFEFLNRIRGRARTVFLFDTLCQPVDVLCLILQDLGVNPGANVAERRSQLNEVLAAEARADRKLVVVIDEAQNLSIEALEAIRLLSNFETSRCKLVQIILSGQPQLADILARPEVAQLRQRLSTICRLSSLSAAETTAYIEYRLALAGYTGRPLFTAAALQLLVEASQGIPRLINTLCFNSLCLCLARNSRLVDKPAMLEAVCDLQLPTSLSAASDLHATGEIPARTSVASRTSVSSPELSESEPSSSRTAHYLMAALLALCITVVGAKWWPSAGDYFHSRFAVFSTLWQAPQTNEAKKVGRPEPSLENTTTTISARSQPRPISSAQADHVIRPREVVVAPGENLETIARTHVGIYDSHILRQIRALNPHMADPNHIEIGATVRLPSSGRTDKPNVSLRNQP